MAVEEVLKMNMVVIVVTIGIGDSVTIPGTEDVIGGRRRLRPDTTDGIAIQDAKVMDYAVHSWLQVNQCLSYLLLPKL